MKFCGGSHLYYSVQCVQWKNKECFLTNILCHVWKNVCNKLLTAVTSTLSRFCLLDSFFISLSPYSIQNSSLSKDSILEREFFLN